MNDFNFGLYEVSFSDGFSMAIKAEKTPTFEEARNFCRYEHGDVEDVRQIEEEEAESFFDCSDFGTWPILRNGEKKDMENTTVETGTEFVVRDATEDLANQLKNVNFMIEVHKQRRRCNAFSQDRRTWYAGSMHQRSLYLLKHVSKFESETDIEFKRRKRRMWFEMQMWKLNERTAAEDLAKLRKRRDLLREAIAREKKLAEEPAKGAEKPTKTEPEEPPKHVGFGGEDLTIRVRWSDVPLAHRLAVGCLQAHLKRYIAERLGRKHVNDAGKPEEIVEEIKDWIIGCYIDYKLLDRRMFKEPNGAIQPDNPKQEEGQDGNREPEPVDEDTIGDDIDAGCR